MGIRPAAIHQPPPDTRIEVGGILYMIWKRKYCHIKPHASYISRLNMTSPIPLSIHTHVPYTMTYCHLPLFPWQSVNCHMFYTYKDKYMYKGKMHRARLLN